MKECISEKLIKFSKRILNNLCPGNVTGVHIFKLTDSNGAK